MRQTLYEMKAWRIYIYEKNVTNNFFVGMINDDMYYIYTNV